MLTFVRVKRTTRWVHALGHLHPRRARRLGRPPQQVARKKIKISVVQEGLSEVFRARARSAARETDKAGRGAFTSR